MSRRIFGLIRRGDRGANVVELALVMPLLLVLLAGMVDFGRAFQMYIVITNASREGAREAARLPCYADDATQRATVKQKILTAATADSSGGFTIAAGDVTILPDLDTGCPDREGSWTIKVEHSYTPMLAPLFTLVNASLSSFTLRSTTITMSYGNDQMTPVP